MRNSRQGLQWMRQGKGRLCWPACLAALALTAGVSRAADIEGISKPSQDVSMAFTRPGQIAKVFVKEGDVVEANQELLRQDDTAEQVQLAQLKADADDETRVKAQAAQLAQKKVDELKMVEANQTGAATSLETQHAHLDTVIAELSLQLAQFEHSQAQLKYDEAKAQLERMKLVSPIAGRVEKIFFRAGESPEALKPVIRIVQIDPLWVEAPVPRPVAATLRVGEAAQVRFPDPNAPPATGKIVFKASVNDPASDTQTVRIEAPNPAGRPAGENVKVFFSTVTDASGTPQPTSTTGTKE